MAEQPKFLRRDNALVLKPGTRLTCVLGHQVATANLGVREGAAITPNLITFEPGIVPADNGRYEPCPRCGASWFRLGAHGRSLAGLEVVVDGRWWPSGEAAGAGHDGAVPVLEAPPKAAEWEKRGNKHPLFNANCSRIAYLVRRKRLQERHFLAAEQLFYDNHMSRLESMAQAGAPMGAGGGYGPAAMADAKLDAMDRKIKAVERVAMAGADAEKMVTRVVLDDLTVERAAALAGLEKRYAMGVLVTALNILAAHYRIV